VLADAFFGAVRERNWSGSRNGRLVRTGLYRRISGSLIRAAAAEKIIYHSFQAA